MARRLSKFNLFMRNKIKAGSSFVAAARAWRGGKKRTINRNPEVSSMARRRARRSSRRSYARPARRGGRRSGGMGGFAGGIVNTTMRAGEAFAVGTGTKMLLDAYANISGFQQVKMVSPYAAAFIAFKKGGGLPGIAAAAPFVLGSGTSTGTQSSSSVTVL